MEREKERERKKEREREGKRESEGEREIHRERESCIMEYILFNSLFEVNFRNFFRRV